MKKKIHYETKVWRIVLWTLKTVKKKLKHFVFKQKLPATEKHNENIGTGNSLK